MPDSPAISIIVSTVRGWPDAWLPVEALRDQLEAEEGELILLDGSGKPAPTAAEVGPRVKWISRPGESVFQLRAAGYDAARAPIVAVTEDHCAPAPDFCRRVLEAHRRHPEAFAIGGAMENGTTDQLLDWATFLVTQGPFIPPLKNGPAERIVGPSALTYKRDALERRPRHGSFGAIELFDTGTMRGPGDVLVNDDSIRVQHHQSMGLRGTVASQFHNGRSIAGFRRGNMKLGDWVRVVSAPILPLYRSVRSLGLAWGRYPSRRLVIACAPLMAFLHYAQMAGEVVGYAAGPGSSPNKLR